MDWWRPSPKHTTIPATISRPDFQAIPARGSGSVFGKGTDVASDLQAPQGKPSNERSQFGYEPTGIS